MDGLTDVEMDVTVRFGLTQIPLHEVVNFGSGSMIEFTNLTLAQDKKNDKTLSRGLR